MQAGFGKRRKFEDATPDFTAMIDCMFLLLMFNMIAFTITGSSDVEVPAARYAKGADPTEAVTITILAAADRLKESTFVVGESGGGPSASLSDVQSAIESAAAEGRRQVVIKAERTVPYRDVLAVARIAGAVEGASLLVAVQQPK